MMSSLRIHPSAIRGSLIKLFRRITWIKIIIVMYLSSNNQCQISALSSPTTSALQYKTLILGRFSRSSSRTSKPQWNQFWTNVNYNGIQYDSIRMRHFRAHSHHQTTPEKSIVRNILQWKKNNIHSPFSTRNGGSMYSSSVLNTTISKISSDDNDDMIQQNNHRNRPADRKQKQQSPSPNKKINRKITISILSILTATTLNLLGFTMTSPLTPTLGKHFSLPTGASFGSLTSAYPLGMLFGLFTWPRLSDFIGRKKIMMISLFGSSIGLGLQSWCIFQFKSLELFLMSRVVTGIFSGCGPVAKAYLADVGDKSGKLAMYLAWRDAASTLAYILGPVFGGILFEVLRQSSSNISSIGVVSATKTATTAAIGATATATSILDGQSQALGSVIGVSAIGSLLAAILIWSFVDNEIRSEVGWSKKNDRQTTATSTYNNKDTDKQDDIIVEEKEYEIIACPLGMKLWTGVATVCVVSFLYHVADSTFFAFFPALLQYQLHLDPRQIGLVFTMLSCITFSFSATSLSSKLISKIGVVNTCSLGLSAIGAGLFALSAASSSSASLMTATFLLPYLIVGAAGLYFCGVPLYGPTIPTMLLQCVPPYQRGAGEFLSFLFYFIPFPISV